MINKLNEINLDYVKKTGAILVLRNPEKLNLKDLKKIKEGCRQRRIGLYIANNIKILFLLKTNRFYISAHNKKHYKHLKHINPKIDIIGSAHNALEINEKDFHIQEIESINDYIVKLPEDVSIPEESTKIHGITNKKMREHGENILDVLMEFKRDISNSEVLVAHNLDFDTSIVSVELLRNNLRNAIYFYRGEKYCTMHI